jgi:hypothetical protein
VSQPFADVPGNYPPATCTAGQAVSVQYDHSVSDWGDGLVFTTYITQWQCATSSPYQPAGRLIKVSGQ